MSPSASPTSSTLRIHPNLASAHHHQHNHPKLHHHCLLTTSTLAPPQPVLRTAVRVNFQRISDHNTCLLKILQRLPMTWETKSNQAQCDLSPTVLLCCSWSALTFLLLFVPTKQPFCQARHCKVSLGSLSSPRQIEYGHRSLCTRSTWSPVLKMIKHFSMAFIEHCLSSLPEAGTKSLLPFNT